MSHRSAATEAPASNAAIAREAYNAYVTKDRAALEALLADDFHFTSPLDNRLDRETYFRRCWPNSKNIEAFDFVHVVPYVDRRSADSTIRRRVRSGSSDRLIRAW